MNLRTALYLAIPVAELQRVVAQWGSWDDSWWGGGTAGDGTSSFIDCGATISVSAVLQSDLHCDCTQNPALVVDGTNTVLDMNGHDVSCGILDPSSITLAIEVRGNSNMIRGPGNVTETGNAIYLRGEGGHTISRVSVENAGVGITAFTELNNIEDVTVDLGGVGFVGIDLLAGRNIVSNSAIVNCRDKAIQMAGSSFNLIQGNLLLDGTVNEAAIYMLNSRMNRIHDNTIRGSSGQGITMDGGGGHVIRGNTLTENGRIGSATTIYINDIDDVHIVENRIFGNRNGISIMYDNRYIVVERNDISHNMNSGIGVNYCEKCKFIGNTVEGHEVGLGIGLFYGTENTVSDNIVNRNSAAGVIVGFFSTNTFLARNTMWGNDGYDLKDDSSSTIIAADNTILNGTNID